MRLAVVIVRVLLGLLFVFFGANGLLHFMRVPSAPGDATLFLTILGTHKWFTVIALLQVIGGLLLLVGRYVPLGLTLLGPIVVNILLFHLFLEPSGLPIAVVTLVLWAFLLFAYRVAFYGIFAADPVIRKA